MSDDIVARLRRGTADGWKNVHVRTAYAHLERATTPNLLDDTTRGLLELIERQATTIATQCIELAEAEDAANEDAGLIAPGPKWKETQ